MKLFASQAVNIFTEVVKILPQATKLCPGCAGLCSPQYKLPELKDYKIVDAKFDGGIC